MTQRGGVVLLLALVVLTLTTAAAWLVHGGVLRERSMEGDALQGARATLAADSALAWFLAEGWTSPPRLKGQVPPDAWLLVPEAVLAGGAHHREEGSIRVRFLGEGLTAGQDVWKLTIQGRCVLVHQGRTVAAYGQVREAYVTTPGGQVGAVPTLRAWRIVR